MNVLLKTSPAWRSTYMLGRLISGLLVVAAVAAATIFAGNQDLISTSIVSLIIVGTIILVAGSVYRIKVSNLYLITSTGVIVESGFPIRTNRSSMSYSKIQIVDVKQGIIDKFIFRTGTVFIDTAAETGSSSEIIMIGIANPNRVAEMIRQGEEAGTRVQWDSPTSSRPSWEQPQYNQPPQQPPYNPNEQRPAPGGWDDPAGGNQPPAPWDR